MQIKIVVVKDIFQELIQRTKEKNWSQVRRQIRYEATTNNSGKQKVEDREILKETMSFSRDKPSFVERPMKNI